MIAAAAAAMIGGVQAALPVDRGEVIEPEGINKIGSGYNISITLKTLLPTAVGGTASKSGGCKLCPDEVGGKAPCYIFEQGTVKINGVMAWCNCGDEDFATRAYLWYGSGKKAYPYDLPVCLTNNYDYTDLPDDLVTLSVNRFSKTNKKVVGTIGIGEAAFAELKGVGFGSYTAATYKRTLIPDTDPKEYGYELKTPAKFSLSGSIIGKSTDVTLLGGDDSVWFPVDDVCTVNVTCSDGDKTADVPAVGTFSVKFNASIAKKGLAKVIPASCQE